MALIVTLLILAAENLAVGSVHLAGNWGFHVVPHFVRNMESGRIGGFFVNSNHLAAFLSAVVFLSAGWLCSGHGGAALKLWLGFMTVAMAVGMSLTVRRGVLFGLGSGVLVFTLLGLWVVWQTQRHFFWSLLGGGLVVSFLAGAVLWKLNEEYQRSRMTSHSMSSDIRLGIWEEAITQHRLAPMNGAGARMFYDGSIQYRSADLPTWTPEAFFAHSEYLQILADYGWIGFSLLGLVILVHVLNGLRFLRWYVREKFMLTGRVQSMNLALNIGELAAVVASLQHAAFEFQHHVPATALCGAMLLGLLANPGFENMQQSLRRAPVARITTKLALASAALALLVLVWVFGRGDYTLVQAEVAQACKDLVTQRIQLDEAARLDSTNGEIFYQRGLAALDGVTVQDRKPESPVLKQAVVDMDRAVGLNAQTYLYRLALADALDAKGHADEALCSIQSAITLASLHEEPRLALGVHWHRLAQWQKDEAAYIWANRTNAMNQEGPANWLSSYHLLL